VYEGRYGGYLLVYEERVKDTCSCMRVGMEDTVPVGVRGEGGGGGELGPLGLHLGRLAPLRLGELGGDDDQAQVDHEERTNLNRTVWF